MKGLTNIWPGDRMLHPLMKGLTNIWPGDTILHPLMKGLARRQNVPSTGKRSDKHLVRRQNAPSNDERSDKHLARRHNAPSTDERSDKHLARRHNAPYLDKRSDRSVVAPMCIKYCQNISLSYSWTVNLTFLLSFSECKFIKRKRFWTVWQNWQLRDLWLICTCLLASCAMSRYTGVSHLHVLIGTGLLWHVTLVSVTC